MTKKHFEDAIAELLHQLHDANPKDQADVVNRLRGAIAFTDRASVQSEFDQSEEDLFDNVPV